MRKFYFTLLLMSSIFTTQAFAANTKNVNSMDIYVSNATDLPITIINSNYSENNVTLTQPIVPANSRILVGTVEAAQDGGIEIGLLDHIGNDPMRSNNTPIAYFSCQQGYYYSCFAAVENAFSSINGSNYTTSAGHNSNTTEPPALIINVTKTSSNK